MGSHAHPLPGRGTTQAHEWEKHGTCAEELFPREVAFFNATLRLHAANPLEVWYGAAHLHAVMRTARGAVTAIALEN